MVEQTFEALTLYATPHVDSFSFSTIVATLPGCVIMDKIILSMQAADIQLSGIILVSNTHRKFRHHNLTYFIIKYEVLTAPGVPL